MVKLMRHIVGGRPVGLWMALFCMLVCIVLGGGGQALSFVNWDAAMRLGFQENDPNDPDITERILAHVEWGVSAGDTLISLPLFLVGLAGLIFRRSWGMVAAMMAAASWVYMFAVYGMQRYSLAHRDHLVEWEDYTGIIAAFALLALVPCLLIIWGLGANADRFAISRPHSHILRRKEDVLEPFFFEDFLICTWQVLRTIPQVWIGRRLNWNVSREEVNRKLAGDEFAEGSTAANRAITIDRPPQDVWPWIARFGRGAGFYTWDFLDNRGHRHPDYVIDGPEPAIGDWSEGIGKICYIETGRELVWYAEPEFLGIKPPLVVNFRMDPVADGATRVHFRFSFVFPKTIRGRIALRIGLLMDHVMSTEMLRRLKVLIETYEERCQNGETNRHRAPHQKSPWRPAASEHE